VPELSGLEKQHFSRLSLALSEAVDGKISIRAPTQTSYIEAILAHHLDAKDCTMHLIQRLILLTAFAAPGLLVAAENTPSLLVPAYFYPVGSGATDWARLTAAAGQVSITAIINPDSGAGRSFDPNYGAAISTFKAAGGTVLGYISTDWGLRSLPSVQADIDKYTDWYPVDGLFFDETTTSAAGLPYYSHLTGYVHQKNSALSLMANPGTVPDEAYIPLFDSTVIYEDLASRLSTYNPPAYMANYSAEHFGMLVIGGSKSVMEQQIAYAASHKLGYIYVNDRSVSNDEWDGLPAYWEAQVAAVQAIRAVPEPDQWALVLAGLGLVVGMTRRRRASSKTGKSSLALSRLGGRQDSGEH
jgi:hypothetical protein